MGNFQYSIDGQNPTTVKHTNGTSNISSTYPLENCLDLTRTRMPSRSSSTGTTRWGFDLGSTMNIAAFSIENTNLVDLFIKGGTDASGVTYTYSENFSFSAGVDPANGRKKFIMVPVTPMNNIRYIQIGPNTNPGGITYYEIGGFGIWKTLTTLNTNVSKPLEITALGPETDDELGAIRLQFNVNARVNNSTALTQYRALANAPRNQVMLWYENNSDTRQVYHVQRTTNMRFSRTQDNITTASGLYLLEVP